MLTETDNFQFLIYFIISQGGFICLRVLRVPQDRLLHKLHILVQVQWNLHQFPGHRRQTCLQLHQNNKNITESKYNIYFLKYLVYYEIVSIAI